jgi:membrane protein DedA with SNARE-associated domain
MNYWKFLLYTTIGAGCWHAILAALGWYLHTIVPENQLNEKIEEYAEYIKIGIIALVVIALVWLAFRHMLAKKRTTTA